MIPDASGPGSSDSRQLLDNYPLIRSRSADEARELVGRVFSPHRLAVRAGGRDFEVRHNQIRIGQASMNVLSYGAEVEIDPGVRGDFYLVQLPLRGRARLVCGDQEAWIDPEVLSVLHPREKTRMLWSGDCSMLLLQVPCSALAGRFPRRGGREARLPFTQARQTPNVSAWWRAVSDMAHNLNDNGQQWLRHPAAFAAMEGFLLCGLEMLFGVEAQAEVDKAGGEGSERSLRRALEYIHAQARRNPSLAEIAAAACVSPRTLEVVFRRRFDRSPLEYARGVRLERVHQALQAAAAEGRRVTVTDVALDHGFVHLGRFAAQYRQRFGCAPSAALRGG